MITSDHLKAISIPPTTSIRRVADIMQNQDVKIVLVCSEGGRLIGTVTDGDLRRAVMHAVDLSGTVERIMQHNPKVLHRDDNTWQVRELVRNSLIRYLPEVDDQGRVIALHVIEPHTYDIPMDNAVVLMAGGKGVRLREYTRDVPKPLLRIGGMPVIERMVRRLICQGFHRFYISVNYLGHMIMEHFRDGSHLGVEIDYLQEDKPLGTAGALSLLEPQPQPFLVANGDLITRADFRDLVQLCKGDVHAVMGVREYRYVVPYGCLEIVGDTIQGISEKPAFSHFINAGIYCLSPAAHAGIRAGEYLNMTDLFLDLIDKGATARFRNISEEWIDIGSTEDFHWAQQLYASEGQASPDRQLRPAA